ncbi:adhesin [Enterococcus gallinarum]|uniref:adhesin n=1 Tax=Enterococcus TaxID=1350 RepID=UPI0032E46335
MNKIPLLIAFFIILFIVFFKIDSLANERAPGKLSLTLRTNRIIYDEQSKWITIPIRPNKTRSAKSVRAVLTYGWDGKGTENKVIGETTLTNVEWVSGIENFLRIRGDLPMSEIKCKNKVDLVIVYDGDVTTIENLKPSKWIIVDLPSSSESSSIDTSILKETSNPNSLSSYDNNDEN